MSSLVKPPKMPKIPTQEPIEEAEVIEEDAETARRRERRRLATTGKRGTILSGIQMALKKRLGE